jgi:hypothetical protein
LATKRNTNASNKTREQERGGTTAYVFLGTPVADWGLGWDGSTFAEKVRAADLEFVGGEFLHDQLGSFQSTLHGGLDEQLEGKVEGSEALAREARLLPS